MINILQNIQVREYGNLVNQAHELFLSFDIVKDWIKQGKLTEQDIKSLSFEQVTNISKVEILELIDKGMPIGVAKNISGKIKEELLNLLYLCTETNVPVQKWLEEGIVNIEELHAANSCNIEIL